jgi:hypothetical protein
MTGKVADLNAQLDDTIGSANSHIQKLQDALRGDFDAFVM